MIFQKRASSVFIFVFALSALVWIYFTKSKEYYFCENVINDEVLRPLNQEEYMSLQVSEGVNFEPSYWCEIKEMSQIEIMLF